MQVRAGEGQSEADNYVLTNTVYKTSMSSGLSSKGKSQVCSSSAPVCAAAGSMSVNVAWSFALTLPAGCMPCEQRTMCAWSSHQAALCAGH